MLETELQKHLKKYQVNPSWLTQEALDKLVTIVAEEIKDMFDFRNLSDIERREVADVIVRAGMGEFEVLLSDGFLMAEGIWRTKEMEEEEAERAKAEAEAEGGASRDREEEEAREIAEMEEEDGRKD